VNVPDSGGERRGRRRRIQGLKAATLEVPASTESLFRTRDNACSFSQLEDSMPRGSPADMAAVVPTIVIPRLLHHRRRYYVRDRRSCQTTEQVLPRGARSGIRDFL